MMGDWVVRHIKSVYTAFIGFGALCVIGAAIWYETRYGWDLALCIFLGVCLALLALAASHDPLEDRERRTFVRVFSHDELNKVEQGDTDD